jgi:LPXTG-motif cell wall-anchored protein
VNTTAPTTASLALPSSQPRWPLAAGAVLLVLLAGVLVSRKRERTWHARALTFAPLAVLVASLLVFASCGGSGNGGGGGGTGKSGTPAGTYAITVTGTSGSVSHTATFTVTVAN